MGNLFAMVTLKKSNIYTVNALKSFFKYTKLEENDEFFLIDNDNSENNQFSIYDGLKIISNKKPLSFAENVNQSIDWAISKKKNLVIGFGITLKTISSLKKADGLVVGSELCREISKSVENRQNPVTNVSIMVKKLRKKIL